MKVTIKMEGYEELTVDMKPEGSTKIEGQSCSQYARFFDDGCTGWSRDPEYNLMFLRCQEQHANERLKTKGHLFLNEVYDSLGIPRTKAGQMVGWIYDSNNGDNYVDFGIFNGSENSRAFVNGRERSILLDFNVDGDIWNLIEEE